MSTKKELMLVMPVYNEEGCVADVIETWQESLQKLNIDYQMLILNDGSLDGTAEVLKRYATNRNLNIVSKKNSGHGPTILEGYRRVVESAHWVFQVDSDNELHAKYFERLWKIRHDYDALFGFREGRASGFDRWLISFVSRVAVRFIFGSQVIDVNVPYRLIRAPLLRKIIQAIPDDTLSPNLLISGAFSQLGARVANVPIPHLNRQTGTISIRNWKLWKIALISTWQTFQCRRAITKNL
jgi:dolichol-phosphate mannosyltransferase